MRSKKYSFSPKIYSPQDRDCNNISRNNSTLKNHSELWAVKDAMKNYTLPPKYQVSHPKVKGDGMFWGNEKKKDSDI